MGNEVIFDDTGVVYSEVMLLTLATAPTEKAALASRRLFRFLNPHFVSPKHYALATRPDQTCRFAVSRRP